jgi:carboxypeptidase C (cathepsin A)
LSLRTLVLLCALALSRTAPAAETPPADPGAPPVPAAVETSHRLTLEDRSLDYTATAGFLSLADSRQQEIARLFTVSYLVPAAGEGAVGGGRPVIFVFNGGPGAASAYLHLGAAGPRALAFAAGGGPPPPPARLADNPETWLRFADLVFIDPVGTGFSYGLKEGKPDPEGEKGFWKADADARILSQAVRLWLARHQRWDSPVFLAGESYGGFRVVLMAAHLVREEGIAPGGLVLISPVLDFNGLGAGELDLLAWAFRLPPQAATAAIHGRITEDAGAEAERFALTGYPAALIGLKPGQPAAAALFATLARLTGLPEPLIARHHGRIPARLFARELLRDQGRMVSLYDGAVTVADPDFVGEGAAGEGMRQDPLLTATIPAFTTAFNDYLGRELGFRTELPYALLSRRVNGGWSWPEGEQRSVLPELRTLLAVLPSLRLLIAHGRTDLVTPYPASCWLADRLDSRPGRDCAGMVRVYDGGHMMYSRPASRRALAGDVRRLVETPAP